MEMAVVAVQLRKFRTNVVNASTLWNPTTLPRIHAKAQNKSIVLIVLTALIVPSIGLRGNKIMFIIGSPLLMSNYL